ncbi:MAG: S-methyl-5'-thioadenosine phosphorylase [Kiritimatiellae bacterium]|nr:S-methyl-5'-thioadenosine phosphorylase [Kiritimatiellia bacterium]
MNIGILGGSGLYDLESLENIRHLRVETPFGAPSDEIVCGTLKNVEVYFLPRHGRGHRLLPSEINHRANIFALKKLGVERVISITAVGSLREEIRPRDIVLPDQYFDRTKNSQGQTFFGGGLVAHVSFGDPTCPELRGVLAKAAGRVIAAKSPPPDIRVMDRGTYVNIEGPAFSTRAESNFYRQMGFDVIGMTGIAEAKLCREAEICYQALSMVTDYDCWHETEEEVSVEIIVEHLRANTRLAREILVAVLDILPQKRSCACGTALANAIITARESIPEQVRETLKPIVGKYL